MFRSRLYRFLLGASVITLLSGILAVMGYSPAQANHAADVTLQAAPERQFPAIGESRDIQVFLSEAATTPIEIDAEIEGGPADAAGDGNTPRSPDTGCTVLADSDTCTITITGRQFAEAGDASAGESLVRIWIDLDHRDGDEGGVTDADLAEGRLASATPDPDPRPKHPTLPLITDADCLMPEDYPATDPRLAVACGADVEGQLSDTPVEPGARGEQDDTDVVSVVFTSSLAGLDCDIINDPRTNTGLDSATVDAGEPGELRCRTTNSVGNPHGGVRIDGENISSTDGEMDQAGANDPRDQGSDDGTADYDNACTTTTAANATSEDPEGSCRVTIPNVAEEGPAIICFWADTESTDDDVFDPAGAQNDGGGCDDERVADRESDDLTDTVRIRWQDESGPPTLQGVDLTPETAENRPGGFAFITARAFDQYGDTYTTPTQIKFELFDGSPSDTDDNTPSSPDDTCTTEASTGQCSIELSSPADGTDLVCGWILANPTMTGASPDGECSGESRDEANAPRVDVVSVTWATPAEETTTTAPGGTTTTAPGGTTTTTQPGGDDDDPEDESGYRFVAADGGVFVFGERGFFGSLGDQKLNKPIVGGATNVATYDGYWMVASDGGVFGFGDAGFYGSLAGQDIPAPIVEIEPTPTGKGYFMVDSRGQVYPFGDAAKNIPDARSIQLNKAIIGMSVTSSGKGYWLVASDGGIFTFGDAKFYGSMGGETLNQPVIDLAPTPDSNGYHLVAADGGVFSFGNAEFKGSTGNIKLNKPAVAMLVAPNGAGYWIVASDGGVFAFGAVPFHGSTGNITLNSPVLDAIH